MQKAKKIEYNTYYIYILNIIIIIIKNIIAITLTQFKLYFLSYIHYV